MTTDLFAQATRQDVRFQLPQGEVTVQQLWKIKQETLFDYEEVLTLELEMFGKTSRRKSTSKTTVQELLELRLAVVSYIIDVREGEFELAQTTAEKKKANALILELISKKQADKLSDLTIEELTALLK
jgi:hypothetical protein